MYMQITTLCNMACAHCCYACDPRKEYVHMDWDLYRHCLELCEACGETAQLGGGEPTCHPHFWRFLRAAVTSDCDMVWLATNGMRTKHAWALGLLSAEDGYHRLHMEWFERKIDQGEEIDEYDDLTHPWIDGTSPDDWIKLDVTLSQDMYHDPISPEIVELFEDMKHEIRDVTRTFEPYNMGSAKTNQLSGREGCCCTSVHIKPWGDVFMCGDDGSLPLGHIKDYTPDTWADLMTRIQETEEIHDMCGYYGLGRAFDEDGEPLIEYDYEQWQYDAIAAYIQGTGDWPAFMEEE